MIFSLFFATPRGQLNSPKPAKVYLADELLMTLYTPWYDSVLLARFIEGVRKA
jgi:hypothetical protein